MCAVVSFAGFGVSVFSGDFCSVFAGSSVGFSVFSGVFCSVVVCSPDGISVFSVSHMFSSVFAGGSFSGFSAGEQAAKEKTRAAAISSVKSFFIIFPP